MIVVYAVILVCCIVGVVTGVIVLGFDKRHTVEKRIGAALPKSTEDLNYSWYQPSMDYLTYYVYIKFRASKQDYIDLMHRMGVETYAGTDPYLGVVLPREWKAILPSGLPWWDPSPDIPDDTALRYESSSGWTVVKYENGYVYIVIYKPIG